MRTCILLGKEYITLIRIYVVSDRIEDFLTHFFRAAVKEAQQWLSLGNKQVHNSGLT